MSVIGPRPLLVEYLPYYTKEEHHRHDVRPGLKVLKDNANQEKLSEIKKFIENYYGSEHWYTQAAELGVLPHSSNLQNGVKLSCLNSYPEYFRDRLSVLME